MTLSMKQSLLLAALLLTIPCATTAADAPADDLVLRNGRVELTFAGGDTFLFKSYRSEGMEMLPERGSTTHPWRLTYRSAEGVNPTLLPRNGYYDGVERVDTLGAAALRFTWRVVLDGGPTRAVRMTVTLGADAELPAWRLDADLPDGWVITEAEFPRIAVARPRDAKGILPVGYGTEYTLGASGQLQARYPSCTGTMQLVMMHHAGGTAYFAAEDAEGCGKLLSMVSEGDAVVFVQQTTASYAWSEGGRFVLPWPSVLGFTREGWQAAALRWYRPFTFETAWGRRTLRERPIVEWIRNADLWLRPGGAKPAALAALRKALAYYGPGVGLHWYYWHAHPFDTNYPDYFPAQEGFAEAVAEAQRLGAHVTPYINGRLWDPATESYRTLRGAEASCRKADGTLYTEVYSSKVPNTVTCPASPIWQQVLREQNRRILAELGTDGVYMDQIGCASSETCYAPNHPHAPGGGGWWPAAYRGLLEGMRRDIYTPELAMTTEENVECYIDLFDMMLIVNTSHSASVRMVPLFPLIYSDRCVYSGYTYIPWRFSDGSMRFITMKSLLWGSQLGWVDPELLMREENRLDAEFLKTLAAFRREQHDLFLGGRFLGEVIPGGDNPRREIPRYETTPVVLAAEWESLSGERAYIVVNMDGAAHDVSLPDGRQITVPALGALRMEK